MLKKNKRLINSFKIGDQVLLSTEGLDRCSADSSNVACFILNKKEKSSS